MTRYRHPLQGMPRGFRWMVLASALSVVLAAFSSPLLAPFTVVFCLALWARLLITVFLHRRIEHEEDQP